MRLTLAGLPGMPDVDLDVPDDVLAARRARLEAAGLLERLRAAEHVRLAPPLGYLAFTALLTRADQRPCGAKLRGRNRVVAG